MINQKNYLTKNTASHPEKDTWCISTKIVKKVKQATVSFETGKSYKYVSRFPIEDENVAVIGNMFSGSEGCATTGSMGIVSDVMADLEIKKNHAAELDFVFSKNPTKSMIKECTKYVEMIPYSDLLQYDKMTGMVFPITVLVRKILAASSVIAFPKLAGADEVEKAKAYIRSEQVVTKKSLDDCYCNPCENANVCLCDIHVNVDEKNLDELASVKMKNLKDGIIDRFLQNHKIDIAPEVNKYMNKYAFIGAVSVMMRGRFANLLTAFLSANPPIGDFLDEMIKDVESVANEEMLSELKAFK